MPLPKDPICHSEKHPENKGLIASNKKDFEKEKEIKI